MTVTTTSTATASSQPTAEDRFENRCRDPCHAVGTVAYAAPEQLMGEQVDGRVDQYALAATAFHLLTGAPLFQHSNPAVVIGQHLNTPPPAIGTRRPALTDLGPVFSKALALKHRRARVGTDVVGHLKWPKAPDPLACGCRSGMRSRLKFAICSIR
jgi:serine/threonine protein kinase